MQIVYEQDGALPADLSMPRGYIVQMKKALEYSQDNDFSYDYFITLSDGMLPLQNRKKLVEYLEKHPHQDIYYELSNSNEDADIQKRFEEYAFFTNAYDFQKSKLIRGMNKMTSSVVHQFKQRKFEDTIYLSYPWFVLTNESAQTLVDNIGYLSDTFKMSLYPEELAFATMLHKFSTVKHHNDNIWLVGDQGSYEFKKPVQPVTQDVLDQHPDALFGTKIHSDTNIQIYQNYFDAYIRED